MRKSYKKRKGGYMPPESPRNNDDDDDVPTMRELHNRLNRLQYPENNDRVVANRNIERDDYPQQVDPRMVGLNADQLDRYHEEMERGNLEAYQNRLQNEGRQGPFTRIDDGDDDDYIEPYDEEELGRRIDAFNNRDGNVQQQGGRKRRKTTRKRKSAKKRKTIRKKRGRKTRKLYKKRKN
jgi:hypothetical protein